MNYFKIDQILILNANIKMLINNFIQRLSLYTEQSNSNQRLGRHFVEIHSVIHM